MVRDAADLEALRALYDAKASAEEDAADALLDAVPVRRSGDLRGRVMLAKGEPGDADIEAGEALAGPDGDAARSALEALGIATDGILALVTRPAALTEPTVAAARLARYIEAADPSLVIALDATAAADLAEAAGLSGLPFGEPARVSGRTVLAADGLEASLTDDARKKRVWAHFRSLGTHEGRPGRRP